MSELPDRGAVSAQVTQLLGDPAFVRSKRQCDLLVYLVEETMAGRGARIKATSIAIDVFGRDESFDQQRDTIVRVEAGRLRRRLEEYFNGAGTGDPIRISIPRGTYQPRIEVSPATIAAAPTGLPAEPRPPRSDRRVLYAIAIVVSITLLITIYQSITPGWQDDESRKDMTLGDTSKPFVMVMPFSFMPGEQQSQRVAFGLVESLIATLAKLEGLSVMAHASILEQQQEGGVISIQSLRREHGVTHVLRGSLVEDGDNLAITTQLVDSADGAVIWADWQVHPAGEVIALEEALTLQIASQLSIQLQPDERARLGHSSYRLENPEALEFYRQGLITLIPPNDIIRIETARQLFRRAQELEPRFAGGYAGESFSHSITVLFLNTTSPKADLDIALPLANRAIEVDPDFGMGYAVRSFARLMSGDLNSALADADQAVSLQPGDAFTRFIQGMNLIIAGRAADAETVLRHALRLDPLESRTPYLNVLAIGQYAAGHYQDALQTLEYNLERDGPRGPHMDLFIAAAYAQLGRTDEALAIMEQLSVTAPHFPAGKWLGMWLSANGNLEETLRSLGLNREG